MNREEILKELDRVEESLFYVNMVDRWQDEDRRAYDTYTKKIKELKEMLKEYDENVV